ncbi:ABC transporter permease [Clostridium tagluense]|uniref:ABC transporter permease n=1 Tax=Clostridium tagluense TaxID=360422 RepID=UPI001CF4DE9C|nr:ABC transporter permease [Clostridium tagluense]MCB2312008.1 ABC transporter permease [Clostridium tagluense]MCB2316595.1 ABC transporter permease [Clostridium tagluense]MCB2321469.1 ABC transporter permease [Clostridium tagluense]MCB2326481.1 ABC transporter permease [Clostridium tagluense]MCB2331187.1 ABC transporter permease [Clostridium tagluense]
MRKNKFIKRVILIGLIIIFNILIFKYCNLESKNITLSYKLTSDKEGIYQLFFKNKGSWSEKQSEKKNYVYITKEKTLKFTIPMDALELRFDLGNKPSNMTISDIELSQLGKNVELDMDGILEGTNQAQIKKTQDILHIKTVGTDPYINYKLNPKVVINFAKHMERLNNIVKLGICIILDFLILILLKRSRGVFTLIQELNNNKVLIWNLSKNDFKTKYAGSYLGITWAFIQPIVTILIYWFVFEFGLKAGSPIKDVPFILWFMTGLVPWFFFQEALLNATNCMVEYSYLVKKVVFKISILPIVKIISALFVHLVFIGFLFIVAAIYGFYPSQYTIQLIYYSFCTFFIALSISYATSAIVIFFKDLGQIINIFLQIGMWMTPIMWSYTIVPQRFQWIVKLNPMYYIVEGYRDTIINHIWFYQRYFQTVYFWIITLGLFAFGAIIFKKLKPHFADIL